jgi:putative membrane protein
MTVCRPARVGSSVHPGRVSRPLPSRQHTSAMLRRAMLTWVFLTIGIGVAAALVPGIDVTGGFFTYLWVGLLFGLVNAILGPILHILSIPLTIITLGLFALVVNGVLLAITAGLSDDLDVGGFLGTILGALIISVVTAVLGFLFRPRREQPA